MKQSKELTEFYQAIQQWIKEGCPKHEVFHPAVGLCCNLDEFTNYNHTLSCELEKQFIDAGLSVQYPFDYQDYLDRTKSGTIYQCPKRLAWIAEHCAYPLVAEHCDEGKL